MKIPFTLACALVFAAPVFADAPAITVPAAPAAPASPAPTKESINELLVDMKVESLVTNMQARVFNAMKAGMQNSLRGQVTTPEQQKVVDDLAKKLSEQIGSELNWASMKPLYTQVYSETFTQQDIDGLIKFYESPTGQVFVSKVPQVMDRTMVLMQGRMGPLIQDLQKTIAASAQEIRNLAPKPTPAGTSPSLQSPPPAAKS